MLPCAEFQHDGGIIHLPEFACSMLRLGGLQILEESRVDRQRSHIFHNPIFGLGLRFFVDFGRNCVTFRRRRLRRAASSARLRIRTAGIWWGSGHPACPIVPPTKCHTKGVFNNLQLACNYVQPMLDSRLDV